MYFLNYYLLDPDQRLYWVYLLSAIVWAVIWQRGWQKINWRWSDYWWHPSARLDYAYFVLIWLIKLYVVVPLVIAPSTISIPVYSFFREYISAPWFSEHVSELWVAVSYTICLFVFGEFTRYWLHRWLHTVTWLWQFHKVHHSPNILTPFTFYRVHPVENFLFGLRYALSVGGVTAIFLCLFGTGLSTWTVLGVNLFVAVFNFLGGNLRHSPIYFRYPACLEKWFISPAQHQLHHTQRYHRFNYGGYLAIWDNVFGTLKIAHPTLSPKTFGFPEKLASQYNSVMALLWQPFVDCLYLWRRKHEKKNASYRET
ncbi:sterol desaturase family protein [Basilea psittacipulmonis]|uniref:Fatty acid hydroxylase domain-containing protein n=1 Tax=Basilea psittacipulmonis DSM 24701 TaxID=1072685 RepID=A0A077DDG4_9BURK|nr:sterol desaturase family protein [Basilea psittacipulmonis]AIL32900.1 hypothetical protein IX83_05820 [Basilea psittacipulmonis DSM 24701]